MVRERVKELLHDTSTPSRAHSLPSSPTSFHHYSRHSRDHVSYSSPLAGDYYASVSPPLSPHSFQSSLSDLDAPVRLFTLFSFLFLLIIVLQLKESDTRTSADFEQLRFLYKQ